MRRPRAAIGWLCLALAVCPPIATAQQRSVAFVGGTLIDGAGAPPLAGAAILIRGDRIAAVGSAADMEIPADATVIDATGKWIIPGLIDAHVHFFQSGGLYTRPDIIDLTAVRPYEEEIARVRTGLPDTFARYIASGVTGVVDMGGPMWNFEVRALAERAARAPRVAVAGPLLGTYAPPELSGLDDPPIVEIDTPDAARAAVRRQLRQAPDLIKIWFVRPGADLAADIAWARAAIEASHAAGVPVVAHATQLRVARAMVEAGADLLAHSIDDRPVDGPLLQAMRRRDVIYVTTLAVGEGYREVFGRDVTLTEIERRLGDPEAIASFDDLERLPRGLAPGRPRPPPERPVDPVMAENLRRMQAGGVTLAAGSDAGNIGTLHGPALHRELELLVQAGLTPMQALIAATRGGAAAMGRGYELGTLEPGKLADLVLLDADPLSDIRNTRAIHRVVKGGEIFDPRAILADLRSGG